MTARTIRVSWCDDEPSCEGWIIQADGEPGPYPMGGHRGRALAVLEVLARNEAVYHWGAEYGDADVEVSR